MINFGVDARMEKKRKDLLDGCPNVFRKNVINKVCDDFRTKVLIQRYLFKRRMVDKETSTRQFQYELISANKAVGYKL